MSRTRSQAAQASRDAWRAKVVAHITAHPGGTLGDIQRAFPGMPRAAVWAHVSSALVRDELTRDRDHPNASFRYYPGRP